MSLAFLVYPLVFLVSGALVLLLFLLDGLWERRKNGRTLTDELLSRLPRHDCGLCGFPTCRAFALSLSGAHPAATLPGSGRAGIFPDPALCLTGGQSVEAALREALATAGKTGLSLRRTAFIACGGATGKAASLFAYAGGADCATAARLFRGHRRCEEACLGFGDCLRACPLGAIRVETGLARVDTRLCTGCGACVPACPKGLISLLPESSSMAVACSARSLPERRLSECSVACTACGECERLSSEWEFAVREGLARAKPEGGGDPARLARIAAACPSSCIRPVRPEKKTSSPS